MPIISEISVDYSVSPRRIVVASPVTELTVQDQHDSIRSIEDSPASMAQDRLIESAGKEDLGGGTLVGITSQLQNAQIEFEDRTTPASVGTATSVDATGTVLVDTAATFITDGLERGSLIVNFTDQSVAAIITVDSETQVTHKKLASGVNNDWTVSDTYKIWKIVQVEVSGGNTTAINPSNASIPAVVPTAFTQIVRTSSASATLQVVGGGAGGDHLTLPQFIGLK